MMENIDINDLLKWTGSQPVLKKEGEISAFSTDSRTVKKDDFFIPLKGGQFDGHEFIADAVNKKVSGFAFNKGYKKIDEIVYRIKKDNLQISALACKNTDDFLLDAARGYRHRYSPVSIGITGSVGKTTTKNFLANITVKTAKTVFSKKSFNNEVGIPKTIFEIDKDTSYFIAEIGMRAEGQVRKLAAICDVRYGIITRIGPSHLEFFGSVQDIARSKAEISEIIESNNGLLFLNGNDEYFPELKKYAISETVICGNTTDYKYNFSNAAADKKACYEFDFNYFDKKIFRARLAIPGYHNIYNAMMAAALSNEIGIKPETIKNALQETQPDDLRMEICEINGKYIINDCYNANPVSLKSAIDTLKTIAETRNSRSVAILGDMLELGSKSDDYHEEIGRYLLEKGIDLLIVFGDKTKTTYQVFRDIKDSANESYYFKDRDSLASSVKNLLRTGDVILIKGSRSNRMEEIINFI